MSLIQTLIVWKTEIKIENDFLWLFLDKKIQQVSRKKIRSSEDTSEIYLSINLAAQQLMNLLIATLSHNDHVVCYFQIFFPLFLSPESNEPGKPLARERQFLFLWWKVTDQVFLAPQPGILRLSGDNIHAKVAWPFHLFRGLYGMSPFSPRTLHRKIIFRNLSCVSQILFNFVITPIAVFVLMAIFAFLSFSSALEKNVFAWPFKNYLLMQDGLEEIMDDCFKVSRVTMQWFKLAVFVFFAKFA